MNRNPKNSEMITTRTGYYSVKLEVQKRGDNEIICWEERRDQLAGIFAKKCLTNPKMQSLFPKNEKIHKMKTRLEESYEITHAKTGRLANSPVIYMQKMLNKL